MPTLRDILTELRKPGRDPRDTFVPPAFRDDLREPKDLQPGMKLEGVVTNIVAFGAFVDVGVHQDGLVHISQLGDRFIRDPAEAVVVGQKVSVTVMSVDLQRNRIALSMKKQRVVEGGTPPGGDANGAAEVAPTNTAPPSRADREARRAMAPRPAPKPASGDIAGNGMRFR
jgi:uncharacterized protein